MNECKGQSSKITVIRNQNICDSKVILFGTEMNIPVSYLDRTKRNGHSAHLLIGNLVKGH